ncbi:MAG: rhodanese-like domain-containing protein [Paracoccaceae bacterium]
MKLISIDHSLLSFSLAVTGLLLAQPSLSQSSFESGSFGDGSFTSQPQQPANQPDAGNTGGGFGGSFGGGGNATTPAQQPQPEVQPAPTVGGSDFNGGGSFGGDFVTPSPGVPAPEPAVQPATPTSPQIPNTQLDPQILAFESRDFGVPPTQELRQGQFHGPTPTSLPGGNVVSTEGLSSALNDNLQMVLIDVLGTNYSLPNAYSAPDLSSPGSLSDRTQQRAVQWLSQITNGQKDMPIVVFCSNPQCWLSYNGSLRVVAAGYNNVYWYRGGLQAWQMAGFSLSPTGY